MSDCPQCEYQKDRAARWRAEAYRQAGHDVIELPWVGLTDAERGITAAEIWGSVLIAPQSYQAFARAIEAKLKEKNA